MHHDGLRILVPNFGEKQTSEYNTGVNAINVEDAPVTSRVIRISRMRLYLKESHLYHIYSNVVSVREHSELIARLNWVLRTSMHRSMGRRL